MSQVTVISGVDRRRMWTEDQKRSLLAAAFAPGANVAEIARRADVRPSQLYRWRRDLRTPEPGFASVVVRPDGAEATVATVMVIELGGAVVRIAGGASPVLVTAVIRSLRR